MRSDYKDCILLYKAYVYMSICLYVYLSMCLYSVCVCVCVHARHTRLSFDRREL